MGFIAGVDRTQQVLFPQALDEYVGPEHPARFIDAFVESLDLVALKVARATPQALGRPAYDPRDLLRLYVYGYLHRIRSSRRLEAEAQRNVELMWLLRKLAPDFKTIADFRRDHGAALKGVCREFTLLCREMDLFSRELVAIDGSKFRAVNSKARNFTPPDLQQRLRRINAQIDDYLAALDRADREEPTEPTEPTEPPASPPPTATALREKIATLRERQTRYRALQEEMATSGATQRSLTDPESRLMKVGQGVAVCYNVQIAVDAKHKLIVAHDVTNEGTDFTALSPMATAAQAVLGAETLEALADRGYYSAPEIRACHEAGITPEVPRPQTSSNAKAGLFTKAEFTYDPTQDEYQCPAGERMTYRGSYVDRTGITQRRYRTAACRTCVLKARCTRSKTTRTIIRWEHEALLDAMAHRLATHPELRAQRSLLAEHPFGTMKRGMDQGYFLLRGLAKVRGEFSLTVLAYNLKRVVNILGVRRMLEALATRHGTSQLASVPA